MYGHMGGMGFGLGFLNFVGTILFFVAVIWAIKFLVRGGSFRGGRGRRHYGRWHGPRSYGDRSSEADNVLRERLAKGEITQDEFDSLKAKAAPSEEDTGPMNWFRGDRALETARLRLAKGEITPDEYDAIRRALTS